MDVAALASIYTIAGDVNGLFAAIDDVIMRQLHFESVPRTAWLEDCGAHGRVWRVEHNTDDCSYKQNVWRG